MKSFDEWLDEYWEVNHNFPCAGEAWDYKQAEIDELKSRLKAINEYQEIIYIELQESNPNRYLMFNKLEDIHDLSKGNTNED